MLDCANSGRPALLLLLLLVFLLLLFAVNTRRGVWICRERYAVPPYPQNVDGQLRNDQAFCTELQGVLKTALSGMCTNNPRVRGKLRDAETKADLIFKHVFCNCW